MKRLLVLARNQACSWVGVAHVTFVYARLVANRIRVIYCRGTVRVGWLCCERRYIHGVGCLEEIHLVGLG